jgi:predicted transcriptional regulator
MEKSYVYSWRLSAETRTALQDFARRRNTKLARVIDEAVKAWLEKESNASDQNREAERLRQAAIPTLGAIASGKRDRASRVRELVSAKLRKKKVS